MFTLAGDPVRAGLVASLAHPGGNATGLSNFAAELAGKQLELPKAAVPRASRVAVLYDPATPAGAKLKQIREVAQALGLDVLKMREPNELAAAFSAVTRWRAEALLALSDPVFGSVLGQLAKLAAQHHVPAMYLRREFAEAGGLLAYGPSFSDNYRRAATYVDKILKGRNPADLPVEQPTKFEFVINLKAAKALGLAIPPSVLARVDEVIE